MTSDIAVLIPSFDGYADIWPIQAELFQRFWPDRPWPIYWVTNGARVPEIAQKIRVPLTPRTEWNTPLINAVNRVPQPFILWWYDEIFPLSPIPNDLFLEGAEHIRTIPDVGIVQLTRYYVQPHMPTVGNFTDYPRNASGYAGSLPAIYRKEILLHFLNAFTQSNYFEQQSTALMLKEFSHMRVLTSCKPMFKLCDNALLAGPWRQCAVKHLTELGIQVDWKKRGISPDACSYMDGVAS